MRYLVKLGDQHLRMCF